MIYIVNQWTSFFMTGIFIVVDLLSSLLTLKPIFIHTFSSVSIVDFEQVNLCWVVVNNIFTEIVSEIIL